MIGRVNTGGSNNLRFRVYAATSLPASGKENDVCIITSTPISVWEVYPHSPTWESDNGHVYIKNEPAYGGGYPNVNVVKKNAIWLYLVRCLQRENGTWVYKDAYQYRNGEWVQFSTTFSATIHITYPAGLTCTATYGETTLTAPDTSGTWECVVPNAGEWVFSLDGKFRETVLITENGQTETINQWHIYNNGAELFDIISFNPVSDVFSAYAAPIKNSDHINFLNSGAVRGSGVYANADLTGFTKLCFQITASGSNINTNGGMYVAQTTNNLWGKKLASTTIDYSSSKAIFVVDVSGFSGEYSCCIGDWSTNYDIKLYRMWLE